MILGAMIRLIRFWRKEVLSNTLKASNVAQLRDATLSALISLFPTLCKHIEMNLLENSSAENVSLHILELLKLVNHMAKLPAETTDLSERLAAIEELRSLSSPVLIVRHRTSCPSRSFI